MLPGTGDLCKVKRKTIKNYIDILIWWGKK